MESGGRTRPRLSRLVFDFLTSKSNLSSPLTMTYISVFVWSPDTHSERRFDSGLTIAQLKVCLPVPPTSCLEVAEAHGQGTRY